jgi:Spy/CpxP family protein refolding chaperone
MKARHAVLTIAVALALAAPTAVLAQAGPGPGQGDGTGPGWGGGQGPHGGGLGRFGDSQGAGMLRIIHRVLRHIDLEPGQEELIEGVLDTARLETGPWVDKLEELRTSFHENHDIGAFDEVAYRDHFQAVANIDVEIKLISADAVSQVWNLLTPEQQEQLEEMRGSFGRGNARQSGGRRSTN